MMMKEWDALAGVMLSQLLLGALIPMVACALWASPFYGSATQALLELGPPRGSSCTNGGRAGQSLSSVATMLPLRFATVVSVGMVGANAVHVYEALA